MKVNIFEEKQKYLKESKNICRKTKIYEGIKNFSGK